VAGIARKLAADTNSSPTDTKPTKESSPLEISLTAMFHSTVENTRRFVDRDVPAHVSGHRRLKVLVGAYACNPYAGSEQGVGWGWVEAISKYHDLWVLTDDQHRQDIEAELSRRPALRSRMKFHYIPRVRYLRTEKIWPPSYIYTYKQWQKAAHEIGKRLHEEVKFDLVHQLTFVGFRMPGMLWQLTRHLCGVRSGVLNRQPGR